MDDVNVGVCRNGVSLVCVNVFVCLYEWFGGAKWWEKCIIKQTKREKKKELVDLIRLRTSFYCAYDKSSKIEHREKIKYHDKDENQFVSVSNNGVLNFISGQGQVPRFLFVSILYRNAMLMLYYLFSNYQRKYYKFIAVINDSRALSLSLFFKNGIEENRIETNYIIRKISKNVRPWKKREREGMNEMNLLVLGICSMVTWVW